jgi:hypothetical protein
MNLKQTKMKKMRKNRIKALLVLFIFNFIFVFFLIIVSFLLSKITGFEDTNFVPGSSTVGHPLITSYREGLKLWRDFLYQFIVFFITGYIFGYFILIKNIEENFDQKDEKMGLGRGKNINE